MNAGGKGSGRRPHQVSDAQVADNWARVFHVRESERVPMEQHATDGAQGSEQAKDGHL